jgi:hypothetical protein
MTSALGSQVPSEPDEGYSARRHGAGAAVE